jgi:hypothetical protein
VPLLQLLLLLLHLLDPCHVIAACLDCSGALGRAEHHAHHAADLADPGCRLAGARPAPPADQATAAPATPHLHLQVNYAAVTKDIETLLTTSQPSWPADFDNYGGLMIRLAWVRKGPPPPLTPFFFSTPSRMCWLHAHHTHPGAADDILRAASHIGAWWLDHALMLPTVRLLVLLQHCAGSYRVADGRGGCDGARIRFLPEFSWADNVSCPPAGHCLLASSPPRPATPRGHNAACLLCTAVPALCRHAWRTHAAARSLRRPTWTRP